MLMHYWSGTLCISTVSLTTICEHHPNIISTICFSYIPCPRSYFVHYSLYCLHSINNDDNKEIQQYVES